VKSTVLSLAGGFFLLISMSSAAADITVPPEATEIEMDVSGNVLAYVIEGTAAAPAPEGGIPPGRCLDCPTIPTLISPSNGANLATIAPLFQWNAHTDPGATQFQLQLATDYGFSYIVSSMSTSGGTGEGSCRFADNFNPATTYYWRTRIVCGAEYGPYSPIWSFRTASGGVVLAAPEPVSPPDGATVVLGNQWVTLDWSSVPGAIDYLLRRRIAGKAGSSVYHPSDSSQNLIYLDLNTTYEWTVRGRNSYGYGNESSPRSFRHNFILGSGDYDGDGCGDIAVFRGNSGLWAVRGVTRLYFGADYDVPVAGDYNGDGTTEPAIFRSTSGLWAAKGVTRVYFGASGDLPIPADYSGDGSCGVGIFRGSSGLWALRGITRIYFGTSGDSPVPADYAGNGTMEPAIFRGASGLWAWRNVTRTYYGTGGDWPVTGDYFGSDTAPTIFRGSSGLWAVMQRTRVYFGANGDAPVPADYNGASGDDIAIFRDSDGLWAVRNLTRVYFGTDDDLPVTR